MNKSKKSLSIVETYVLEPIEGVDVYSACTGFYTNTVISCSGNTQLNLGVDIISTESSISATTFFGDGSNLTGISTQDTFVTGGTYNSNNGTAIFTNNSGGTFSVSGFSTGSTFTGGVVSGLTATTISATTYLGLPLDIRVTGATKSGSVATFRNNTGGTFTLTGLTDTIISKTSELINDGKNGVDPFVDNQDNLVIKLEYSWDKLSLDPDTATDLDIELAIQNQIEGYKVDERQHLYIVIDNGDVILNIFTFADSSEVITINDFETQIGFTLDNPTIEYVDGITTITFTNSGYFIPNNSFEFSKVIYVKSYAIEIGEASFTSSSVLEEIDFPILEVIGNGSFVNCFSLQKINLPSVIFYGDDTGNNEVFTGIVGNAIEITTPIIHQTSNGGRLEEDLVELDDNNAVTFNWI